MHDRYQAAGCYSWARPGSEESELSLDCVICHHFSPDGGGAINLIGLATSVEGIIAGSSRRIDSERHGAAHVMAHVCSQHVVEIYRGRVPGVAMAWRVATPA